MEKLGVPGIRFLESKNSSAHAMKVRVLEGVKVIEIRVVSFGSKIVVVTVGKWCWIGGDKYRDHGGFRNN